MDSQLLEHLRSLIEERKQVLISHLAQGSATDFPVYKELCGRVAGLTEAQFELDTLLQKLKANNE